ncbi:MAG: DNA translocase FtsK 4TM domain-containing protein [Thermodesulfobacteriota bacterium]
MARKIPERRAGGINSMLVPASTGRSSRSELGAIVYFCAGLFVTLAIASYDPRDPSFNVVTSRPQISNLCGLVGSHVADALVQAFGFSSMLVAVCFGLLGARTLLTEKSRLRWTDVLAAVVVISATSSLLNRLGVGRILGVTLEHPGGALGILLHTSFLHYLGKAGEILVGVTLMTVSLLHLAKVSASGVCRSVVSAWSSALKGLHRAVSRTAFRRGTPRQGDNSCDPTRVDRVSPLSPSPFTAAWEPAPSPPRASPNPGSEPGVAPIPASVMVSVSRSDDCFSAPDPRIEVDSLLDRPGPCTSDIEESSWARISCLPQDGEALLEWDSANPLSEEPLEPYILEWQDEPSPPLQAARPETVNNPSAFDETESKDVRQLLATIEGYLEEKRVPARLMSIPEEIDIPLDLDDGEPAAQPILPATLSPRQEAGPLYAGPVQTASRASRRAPEAKSVPVAPSEDRSNAQPACVASVIASRIENCRKSHPHRPLSPPIKGGETQTPSPHARGKGEGDLGRFHKPANCSVHDFKQGDCRACAPDATRNVTADVTNPEVFRQETQAGTVSLRAANDHVGEAQVDSPVRAGVRIPSRGPDSGFRPTGGENSPPDDFKDRGAGGETSTVHSDPCVRAAGPRSLGDEQAPPDPVQMACLTPDSRGGGEPVCADVAAGPRTTVTDAGRYDARPARQHPSDLMQGIIECFSGEPAGDSSLECPADLSADDPLGLLDEICIDDLEFPDVPVDPTDVPPEADSGCKTDCDGPALASTAEQCSPLTPKHDTSQERFGPSSPVPMEEEKAANPASESCLSEPSAPSDPAAVPDESPESQLSVREHDRQKLGAGQSHADDVTAFACETALPEAEALDPDDEEDWDEFEAESDLEGDLTEDALHVVSDDDTDSMGFSPVFAMEEAEEDPALDPERWEQSHPDDLGDLDMTVAAEDAEQESMEAIPASTVPDEDEPHAAICCSVVLDDDEEPEPLLDRHMAQETPARAPVTDGRAPRDDPEDEAPVGVCPTQSSEGAIAPHVSSHIDTVGEPTRSFVVAKRADDERCGRPRLARTPEQDDYQLPPTSVLESPPESDRTVDEEVLATQAAVLERKLLDLGVRGEVVEIHPGPVITMFEVSLGPGIPLRKILNMADDLAMALKSGSTRIVAPIAGKDTVGIEVPNQNREIVYFREVVESPTFANSRAPLKMAVGKGIDGQPFSTSLARMPHLLIAGATGTGKSVGLNCLICSWLMSHHPDDLKLILVDPKKLELSYYQDIPHLLHPVVTDPEVVPKVLNWAIREMERRYDLLSQAGAKNIDGYNKRVLAGDLEPGLDGEEPEKLPYIVIIVDELAELMMVAAKDIEVAIARLAQMARAAGIHLILATQRPSVDVITGLIKANFPARLSFQVSAKADSRTILDTVGAEHLLGRGDLLFLPPGTAKLTRLHGAFVSENDIKNVVDFIKVQRAPVYLEEITKQASPEPAGGPASDLALDPKYDEAVELVSKLGHASISLIQRHMRIGYNRAARIVEAMEAEGIIGPSDGTSRPREVLVGSLQHLDAAT